MLVLQLAGLPHHASAAPDAKTVALAGLTAAIGAPVPFCDHGDGPVRPGDPADHGSCEHCIFCHSVAVGLLAMPVGAADVARVAISGAVERPRAEPALVRARHRGGATPRGPPAFG